MKWLPTGLALAALLGITGISSTPSVAAVAAPAGDDRCTASDVQRLAHHIFDVVTLAWTDDGSAEEAQADHLFEDCQFRLYDDNDPEDNPDNPEIPHVFSEDDYFLAGISAGYTYAELEELGFTRAEAIAEMNKFTDRFFWGPATATDAELEEIELASTPYLDAFLGDDLIVGNHIYVLFKANKLDPGDYKWRWEVSFPGEGTGVTYGAVTITPGT